MDRISLNGLTLTARVGVSREERRQPQTIELDITLDLDLQEAGLSDDIHHTVDYRVLMQRVEAVAATRSFKLLESLTQAVADCVLDEQRAVRVTVRAAKRYPIGMESVERVSVEITRER